MGPRKRNFRSRLIKTTYKKVKKWGQEIFVFKIVERNLDIDRYFIDMSKLTGF